MTNKCLACGLRSMLLDEDWLLNSTITAANVHKYANARQGLIGALDFIRVGKGDCKLCVNAATTAYEARHMDLPSGP